MKEKRIKSALPIYLASLAWVLTGLFLSLYQISGIIIGFCLSALIYIISSKFFQDKIILVEEIDKADTGDKNADEVINKGRELIIELEKINLKLDNEKLKGQVFELKGYSEKIIDFIEKDTSKARNIRSFMAYYLPTTVKLLKDYEEISSENMGDNTTRAVDKIENVMETIITAFKNQLDSLYEDKTLDVVTEVKVLEELLKREGLTGSELDIRKKGE